MSHALLAALLVASAQTPAPAASRKPAAAAAQPAQQQQQPATTPPADAPAAASSEDAEALRKEFEQKLEAAKEEVREEIRAQLATQSLEQGWQEEWVEEKRKLELFTLDGYLRVRPTLFNKLDLGRPASLSLVPYSPRLPGRERTLSGADMRVRLDPTLNVSEEVRVKLQVDALDNLVLGSTPDSAWGASTNVLDLFSESQTPPQAGVNAVKDSIVVRRAYGEVSTPLGILRFGRMGSHWGLGMLRNDGNCLDCDFGDTVDRVQFVAEPLPGLYVAPMLDFNSEGPVSARLNGLGEARDLSNGDDAHSWVLAIARRDTEAQQRQKLDAGQSVFNYGLHLTYRTQTAQALGYEQGDFPGGGGDVLDPEVGNNEFGYVSRRATLWTPDVWVKFEKKDFRLELEAAAHYGSYQQGLTDGTTGEVQVLQYGAVAQGEYRFLKGQLKLGLEVGFASGDRDPGMGSLTPRGTTLNLAQDTDLRLRNFHFNRDYRVDMILWRELVGGITDAVYAKPTLRYTVADGFELFGAAIYSQAVYPESAPAASPTSNAGVSAPLGLELNAGARYETEDGFVAGLQYGILFPLDGLAWRDLNTTQETDNAQALRAVIGVKF